MSTLLLDPKDPEIADLLEEGKPGETVEAILRFKMPAVGDGPMEAKITEIVSMEPIGEEKEAPSPKGRAGRGKGQPAVALILTGSRSSPKGGEED